MFSRFVKNLNPMKRTPSKAMKSDDVSNFKDLLSFVVFGVITTTFVDITILRRSREVTNDRFFNKPIFGFFYFVVLFLCQRM